MQEKGHQGSSRGFARPGSDSHHSCSLGEPGREGCGERRDEGRGKGEREGGAPSLLPPAAHPSSCDVVSHRQVRTAPEGRREPWGPADLPLGAATSAAEAPEGRARRAAPQPRCRAGGRCPLGRAAPAAAR